MRVIFTSLGPNKKYACIDGAEYEDGDVVDLSEEEFDKAVIKSKFAQEYDPDLEIRTKRLLESARKKREAVLLKMQNIKR